MEKNQNLLTFVRVRGGPASEQAIAVHGFVGEALPSTSPGLTLDQAAEKLRGRATKEEVAFHLIRLVENGLVSTSW